MFGQFMYTAKSSVCYRPYHAASAVHDLRNDEQFLIRRFGTRAADGALVTKPDREAESLTGSSKRRESEDCLRETHCCIRRKRMFDECSPGLLA